MICSHTYTQIGIYRSYILSTDFWYVGYFQKYYKADSPVLTYIWQTVLITNKIAYPVFKTKYGFEGSTVSAVCCKQQFLLLVMYCPDRSRSM